MERQYVQTAVKELGYTNLRVKQKEAILHYLCKVKVCSFRSQLVAAKLLLLHIASSIRHNIKPFSKKLLSKVYCHCCQSSGNADLALLSTASQVVESKVDKRMIPLWDWHRCLKVSTTSKATSSGFNFK